MTASERTTTDLLNRPDPTPAEAAASLVARTENAMYRFRVQTTYRNRPTRNRYFRTSAGCAAHIIKALGDSGCYAIMVYDKTYPNQYGCLGRIGGLTSVRYHLTRIAERLQNDALGEALGLHPEEWKQG